jgi:hypothetical protein
MRPPQLAGHAIDSRRHHRTGMHVQSNARTLTKHRGLPRMSDRPSRATPPRNPRSCVSEAPARNRLATSRSRHTV